MKSNKIWWVSIIDTSLSSEHCNIGAVMLEALSEFVAITTAVEMSGVRPENVDFRTAEKPDDVELDPAVSPLGKFLTKAQWQALGPSIKTIDEIVAMLREDEISTRH